MSDSAGEPAVEEITELAARQSTVRALIRAAFESRLGTVPIDFDFHRGWNGGWRCRATVAGKPPLDFALLRTPSGALLALPTPMPSGWRLRGVRDSSGASWSVNDDQQLHPVPLATE